MLPTKWSKVFKMMLKEADQFFYVDDLLLSYKKAFLRFHILTDLFFYIMIGLFLHFYALQNFPVHSRTLKIIFDSIKCSMWITFN